MTQRHCVTFSFGHIPQVSQIDGLLRRIVCPINYNLLPIGSASNKASLDPIFSNLTIQRHELILSYM